MEALRGQEPPGATLIDDAGPRPKVVDPLVTTLAMVLVGGVAAGAGKRLGEMAITWLIERIRSVMKKRKASVIVTVAGVQFTVDEQTDPDQVAAQFGMALGRRP